MKLPAIFSSLGLLAVALHTPGALASTLCVTVGGQLGCYSHIAAAVAAAAPGDTVLVGPGTFYEGVIITKPLSLAAFGATIDATGIDQGIFINGMAAPGLASVHISGFTVQHANDEGILVLNASAVTLSDNTVQSNDKALVGGKCTALPAFETAETTDCGEGIHLQGADHAIVTGNTMHGNSGGLLISDDTAASHDNLVTYNTVSDNPYACGITLASHVPVASLGAKASFGVFHNTVYKNSSSRNGLMNGGGSGVGIFASVPGAKAYANVVVENTSTNNGIAGIAMHAHAPGQLLTDNIIVGNILNGNAADSEDAATPGPTGLNIYSLTPQAGNIVAHNAFINEAYDVAIKDPALVQVEFNLLTGAGTGVINQGTAAPVDASENWWGCALGPQYGGTACTKGTGPNMATEPWLVQAP